MSHQDTDRLNASTPRYQDLARVLNALLEPPWCQALAFRSDCTWTPLALAAAALLWAWSDELTLVHRFVQARQLVAGLTIRRQPPATTYQAFLKMLRRWTGVLAVRLIDAFRQRMRVDLAEWFLIHGFCLFAVDGSRLGLPRTRSHEQRFSPASVRPTSRSKGSKRRRRRARTRPRRDRDPRGRVKKSNNPQMWLTTLYHLGTNRPWDWRTGPSDSSERDHFLQMIDALPESALVTRRRGIRRIPRLDDADRQWATPADPGRIERAVAEETGGLPGNAGTGLPLAGPRSGAKPTAAGAAAGRGARRPTSGLPGDVGAGGDRPFGPTGG